MNRLFCGFDFGTSNTVVTVIDDAGKTVASIADATVLFLPDCGAQAQVRYVGTEAIERYSSSGMNGRFVQSIKSSLSDPAFTSTEIFGKRYSIEELISMILRHFKEFLEERIGRSIENAVFGRPVRFSDQSDRDTLAQSRLLSAAERCGFKNVQFRFEPVAAAERFRGELAGGHTALVCDYGGGTSDFSVVRQGDDDRIEVMGTFGVRVGGDDFDGEIMWNRLVPYFGFGTTYESYGKMLPVPVHIYRTLMKWERISFLKTMQYRDDLKYIRSGATDKIAIEWLIKLIDEDLGFALFRSIRDAKHALSDNENSAITFFEKGIELKERIYRDEFAEFIASELSNLDTAMDTVLEMAGIGVDSVDLLLLTGGSSLVEPIRIRLYDRFPAARSQVDTDRFHSISTGLAFTAKELGVAV